MLELDLPKSVHLVFSVHEQPWEMPSILEYSIYNKLKFFSIVFAEWESEMMDR